MKLRINTFAVLKDYLGQSFEIEADNINTINDLKEELSRIKPEAKSIIGISRFAVNNTFVQNNSEINHGDHIFIVPPSSGG